MAYTASIPVSFGSSRTGLTDLRMQPRTASGATTGSAISTGFAEIGRGMYTWTGIVPDDAVFAHVFSLATPTIADLGLLKVIATDLAGGALATAAVLATANANAAAAYAVVDNMADDYMRRSDEAVLPDPAPEGYGGDASAGDGDVAVDHNHLGQLITRDGVGVDNAIIRAYLATDYAAGDLVVRGKTYTNADGEWVAPLMLNAGTYKVVVYDPLTRTSDVFDLTVVAP